VRAALFSWRFFKSILDPLRSALIIPALTTAIMAYSSTEKKVPPPRPIQINLHSRGLCFFMLDGVLKCTRLKRAFLMHRTLRFSLILSAIAASSVALAADLPSRRTQILSSVPAANWEGFYAGTFLSVGQALYHASQTVGRADSGFGSNMGMLAGYNLQNGAWVYGLEGDIALNVMRKTNSGVTGLVAHESELLDSGHLRARLGYELGDILPYAAAGVTYAQGSVRIGEKGAVKTHYGFNLGVGLDWRVQLPILGWSVLRAEYVYDRLSSANYIYDSSLTSVRLRPDTHLLRAAFIYTPNDHSWSAPASEADWAGNYAGFIAGYGNANFRTKSSTARQKLSSDGGMGGIYAGRNFTFDRWVVGYEGATMLNALKGTGTVPGTSDAMKIRNYLETDLRVRAGYSAGRFLPFIAAGHSNGRSEQTDSATLSKRTNVSTNAWNVGAGVDYMLTDRISTRIEYLHAKSWNYRSVDLNSASLGQSRSSDQVRAGLAWHFH